MNRSNLACFVRVGCVTTVAGCLCAAAAGGEPPAEGGAPAGEIRTGDAPEPILAGPPVSEDATPGEGGFGGDRMNDRREGLPVQMWLRLVHRVDLTAEQREAVRARVEAFRAELDSFRTEHADEIESLRERARAARVAMKPDPTIVSAMRTLRQAMPRPEDAQREIWNLLTPEQRSKLTELVADARRRIAERRSSAPPAEGTMTTDEAPAAGGAKAPDAPGFRERRGAPAPVDASGERRGRDRIDRAEARRRWLERRARDRVDDAERAPRWRERLDRRRRRLEQDAAEPKGTERDGEATSGATSEGDETTHE